MREFLDHVDAENGLDFFLIDQVPGDVSSGQVYDERVFPTTTVCSRSKKEMNRIDSEHKYQTEFIFYTLHWKP